MIAHRRRYGDASRRCDAFQSRCYINSVPENVVSFHYHIAYVDADSKFDSRLGRHAGVPSAHGTLNLCGAGNGTHHAWEFNQYSVAGKFDDAAVVLGDFWIHQIFPQCF